MKNHTNDGLFNLFDTDAGSEAKEAKQTKAKVMKHHAKTSYSFAGATNSSKRGTPGANHGRSGPRVSPAIYVR